MKHKFILSVKKSAFLVLLFFTSILFNSCSINKHLTGNKNWKLIYENDAEGNVVNGNLENLIKAVENGQEIRVIMISGDTQYITSAENIWIKNDIVFIQNTTNISCTFKDNNLTFVDDAYYWYFILNSSGIRNMSRWSVGEHKLIANSSDKVAAKWFVK